jgi:hypothetical protein
MVTSPRFDGCLYWRWLPRVRSRYHPSFSMSLAFPHLVPFQLSAFVEVGTPVARRPPHRSRRAVFPHRALRVDTLSSLTGRFARWARHSYGTGCLCVLRQHVGPFSSFGACALPLDTMDRSDSRSARRHFLSLRRPSCLALAVSAAGTLRASSVPCVCLGARHALRPRQAGPALTIHEHLRFGFRHTDTVPACVCCFRGCIA